MLDTITEILRKALIMAAVIFSLGVLGGFINALIPWDYLLYFFIMIRQFSLLFDFMLDTTTLITLIGLSITIYGAVWGFRAFVTIIKASGWGK